MKGLLTIIELREISNALLNSRGLDISILSQFQAKRNIKLAMSASRITNFQDYKKSVIEKDEVYFTLLDYLYNEKTTLFREPAMWRIFRDELIKKTNDIIIHVWFPDFSIEELYTFIHIIETENIKNKFSITASHFNPSKIAIAKTSLINKADILQAESNYKRYYPDATNGFHTIGSTIKLETDLLKSKVFFINKKITDFKSIGKFNIVFFRNRLLYYKMRPAQDIVKHIGKYIKPGGFLITGSGENISSYNVSDYFSTYNEKESVYKRKF